MDVYKLPKNYQPHLVIMSELSNIITLEGVDRNTCEYRKAIQGENLYVGKHDIMIRLTCMQKNVKLYLIY